MGSIALKYGADALEFEFGPDLSEVGNTHGEPLGLTDSEIGNLLEQPIGSSPLEDLVKEGNRVLLVVPDATRQSGCAQIVNLLVRRLIANGSKPTDINIIFATGIHRPVTAAEKESLLTPFIAQRIKTITHKAGDPIRNFRVGETAGGIPVELNWVLTEYDHVVLIGSVTFHYFAGFTGGRKLVCPGLASEATIAATHELAFDRETRDRRAGVGTGLLDGNPVHEAFVEAASFAHPAFAISTIVNDAGEVSDVICGDWKTSHSEACRKYHETHSVRIASKREFVLASCGGYPFDINMIQAHKTLEAASRACTDGGTIVLLAECSEGLGRSDFLDWFDSADSVDLAERLCANYHVNGQTAWSLLKKTERFNVEIMTMLPDEFVRKMRMTKLAGFDVVAARVRANKKAGYILPAGSRVTIETLS